MVLAVDGGASKTDAALVAADGSLLGRARGPASNHQLVGMDGALEALETTVRAVADDAAISPDRSGRVAEVGSFCLAGLDLAVDEQRLGPTVRERDWVADPRLWNDTFAVLRAGVSSGWGVGVVCGTGLNCVALGPGGSSVRFPALGELSGDFAPGGVWLAMRGLGLALRAGDGRGGPTALRELVPGHLGFASAEDVLEAVYSGTFEFARLIGLAEVVLAAAGAGDRAAQDAVDLLVSEVVAMIGAAVERLEVDPAEEAPLEIVAGGGLFEDARFAELVLAGARRRVPPAVLRRLDAPPLLGAALLGLDAAGAAPGAEERLRAALGTFGAD